MSEHIEPHESLHLTVVRESSKNYQSYLRKRKSLAERDSFMSNIRRFLSEEAKTKKRLRPNDAAGLN